METINDRMEMLVNERFNGNKAAFAKAIGIERATLSNYIGSVRRSKPSVDMVTKIVVALNVDARWLLTGKEDEKHNNVSVGDNSDGNVAIGSHNSVGNVTTNAGDTAVLEERVKSLEALLAEKERLIKVLMNKSNY
jgi:transcriptional regulator with XRE-family HTH domain